MAQQADAKDLVERYEQLRSRRKEDLDGTLGNELTADVARPLELASRNWFPAKLSDVLTDAEWLVQYTCCEASGTRSCTETSCPVMGAGKYSFPWQDLPGPDGQPAEAYLISAPRFAHKLIQLCTMLRTADNFWYETGKFYDRDQSDYRATVEPMLKLLMYRILCVYSHVFHHHWIHHHKAKTEDHFNHIFKHFVWFTSQCKLLTNDELKPLKPVIDCMFEKERKQGRAPPIFLSKAAS